jgi:hypothetical protein
LLRNKIIEQNAPLLHRGALRNHGNSCHECFGACVSKWVIIANEPGQLLTVITKGQGQRSASFPKNQNFDFTFPGRSKFLEKF